MKLRSVRYRWFVSYLLVLAVPLVLSLGLYRFACAAILRQTQQMHNAVMEQIRIELDDTLVEMQQILDQAVTSSTVQKMTAFPGRVRPADQLTLVDELEELAYIKVNHPAVHDVFIYMNHTGTVLGMGGHMTRQLFYSLYFADCGMAEPAFDDYFAQYHVKSSVLPLDGSLLFARTTLASATSKQNSTVVAVLSQKNILQILENACWDPTLQYAIFDAQGAPVLSTGESFPALSAPQLEEGAGFHPVVLNGKTYDLMVLHSTVNGWRYVSLAPEGLLRQSARRIQLFTMLGMLACMVLCLALSMWLTKRNYTPLGQLLTLTGHAETTAEGGNEYELLEQRLKQFFRQSNDAEHALWNSARTLQNYYVYSLLADPDARSRTEAPPVNIPGPRQTVVLFSAPGLAGSGNELNHSLVRYAMLNVFGELAAEKGLSVLLSDVGQHAAAIVGVAGDADTDALCGCVETTQQKMQEYFKVSVCAALSGTATDAAYGLHLAYLEAVEALGFAAAGTADLVEYRDICDLRAGYQFPLEAEQKLINLIVTGNVQGAAAQLDELLRLNKVEGLAASVQRCLAFEITAAITKGASQAGVTVPSNLQFLTIEHCSPRQLAGQLHEMLQTVCAEVQQRLTSAAPADQLCGKLREYITAHYSDPDLNISITGLHFDMTPAYLSTLFKKQTGQSLLEFLNQTRVDAAKELLAGDHTVAEVAVQTGFRDSGALIRVFKKVTGLTPGQYRAQLSEVAAQ